MKIININQEIGLGGLKNVAIQKELKAAQGDDITVKFSSVGGSVFEGINIFDSFREYKEKYPMVTMHSIIVFAASMASYISVSPSFDTVTVYDNSTFMMHNSQGTTAGDYREMKKFSETLNGINSLLAKVYAKRMNKSIEEIRQMMDEETWLFGEEILNAGLATKLIETGEPLNRNTTIANLKSKYSAISGKISEDIAAHADSFNGFDFQPPGSQLSEGFKNFGQINNSADMKETVKRQRIAAGLEVDPMDEPDPERYAKLHGLSENYVKFGFIENENDIEFEAKKFRGEI